MKKIIDYLFFGVMGLILILNLYGSISLASSFHNSILDWLYNNLYYFFIVLGLILGIILLKLDYGIKNTEKENNFLGKYFVYLIALIIVIGVGIRIYNIDALGFSNDEGFTALYSYFINNSGLPCIQGSDSCYIRGLPYHYFVSLFTMFGGASEMLVRLPGIVLFTVFIIFVYKYLSLIKLNRIVILLVIILLSLGDYLVVMSNLARMYIMMLTFVVMFLYYYTNYSIMNNRTKSNLIMIFVSGLLAILSHELGLLLAYFVLDFILFRRKSKLYVSLLTGLGIGIFMYLFLSIPKILYFDSNYLSYFDIIGNNNLGSYMGNIFTNIIGKIQGQNWYFPKLLIDYLPFVFIFSLLGIIKTIQKDDSKLYPLIGFCLFSIMVMSLYKIEHYPRYSWWIFSLFTIIAGIGFFDFVKYGWRYYLLFGIFVLTSTLNIYNYKNITYGTTINLPEHIVTVPGESYYPDDKTFVSYIQSNYKAGDIFIYDYWIQEVNLVINDFPSPEYLISKYDPISYLQAYHYQKLYEKDGSRYLYKGGPRFIQSRGDLLDIIENNKTKNIYYISSADYNGQRGHTIGNKNIYNYIADFYPIVYKGKDDILRIFKLN
ncbi:MAG: hypothetical protein V3575_04375 [Candidatus Absconditabacteria bacterium]